MAVSKEKKKTNPAGKQRSKEEAFATWIDPFARWRWYLLKSWQADNGKPNARWSVYAASEYPEMGDMYVSELLPGLAAAAILSFDTTIWPTKEDFLTWATGSA